MKIKAIRPQYGSYGHVSPGQVIDVPEKLARELIGKGRFEEYKEPVKKSAKKVDD